VKAAPLPLPTLTKTASKKEKVAPVLAKKTSKKEDMLETLFILMLDMSGSMSGQRWTDLMSAVRQFLSAIEADKKQQDNSRVTIITYENNAVMNYDQVVAQ
jgi:uncharacterized protein YegL